MLKKHTLFLICLFVAQSVFSQSKIEFWLTKNDQTVLLQKQTNISFDNKTNNLPTIKINENQTFQTIDGFGYSLTGGSAYVINQLDKVQKNKLLQELFGNKKDSISVRYFRISICASDLIFAPFNYNDLPEGETD
ncbi:MAG: glucosylceramidase, partial [Acidobacteriota bacterium]